MPRALVIGGGVAGPAVALFLQRAGWDVEIFEAAAEPDPYAGLFLNVATNGLAVLDRARPARSARGRRAPRARHGHVASTGKRLGTVPNGPAREPERGSVVVRRGVLHQVLREAAQRGRHPDHVRRAARARSSRRMPRCARSSPTAAPPRATSSSAPTASVRPRAAISTRMPRRRVLAASSASAASPACPGSRRRPTRSTWCSARARSSATSCATTARCTGSRTSPRRDATARRCAR